MTIERLQSHENSNRAKSRDHLTPERRSWNMSRIRAENTKPEILVRKALRAAGMKYRTYAKHLPGKPDIVLPKHKWVIFVHGCFWHRHKGCSGCTTPTKNRSFWLEKFSKNIKRDRIVKQELKKRGWNASVIWECEAENTDTLKRVIANLKNLILIHEE